jgi:hypothetical protein
MTALARTSSNYKRQTHPRQKLSYIKITKAIVQLKEKILVVILKGLVAKTN